MVEENKEVPLGNERGLEEFIPTRLTCVTVLKASITVSMAEFNLLHILLPAVLGQKVLYFHTHTHTFEHTLLPAILVYFVLQCFFHQGLAVQLTTTQFHPVRPLPAIRMQVERVNLEHSVPMYGIELIHTVSSLSMPSDNLLHHCYTHCCLKVVTPLLVSLGLFLSSWI